MTLDCGTSFLYVVNVRLSVLQSNFRGYSCMNTMTEKWKNLKAATAFQIFVCFSNRVVLRKNHSFTASC